ncbi:iron-siderophore ABC transporter substrate-binding protein [Thalassospira sp. MA62]|nr:iron-siderophore ABC transporter substrate-binding protein [Thalassospira sp. MA62]
MRNLNILSKALPVLRVLGVAGMASGAMLGMAHADVTVETANGPVTVPDNVERVIALSEESLDAVLALGVKPLATVQARGQTGVSPYLQELADGVEMAGTSREYNLERIVALRPDVIFTSARLRDNQYNMLSKIAPTIVPESAGFGNWTDSLQARAEILDREDKADELLAELDDRIADVKAKIGDRSNETVAIVRWTQAGPQAFTWHAQGGQILQQLGFGTVPFSGDLTKRPHSDPLSLENMSAIDADWLIVGEFGEGGSESFDAVRDSAVYQNLRAVENDQIVVVDGSLWTSASGPLSSFEMLDDIEEAFVGHMAKAD